jgi:hypothetical protein
MLLVRIAGAGHYGRSLPFVEPDTMKQIPLLAGIALVLAATHAHALTPQQEKMKTCNAEAGAKGLKGADRQSFMKTCLAAQPAGAPLTPQQQKMKTCNADAAAKGLSGEGRKKFMSGCLSNAPAQ